MIGHYNFALIYVYPVVFVITIFSSFFVLPASESSIANNTSDTLIIEPKILDFGRVNETKDVLELQFIVSNQSEHPVEISSTKTGCGCTVAKLSSTMVPPHDQILASVEVRVLGRRGKFAKEIQLDVAGKDDPVTVPIRGTITQDLWFDGPMLQCFLKGAETTVEKEFEIRTVDWPDVQFDWSVLDKLVSIKEISRIKESDETVIKLRLSIKSIPIDQSTVSWHVVISPTDKRIKELIIPVGCYRAISRKDNTSEGRTPRLAKEDVPSLLKPERISLGVIPSGEEREFELSGLPELTHSLKITSIEGFPADSTVELRSISDSGTEVAHIAVYVGDSLKSGLVKGTIHLNSPLGGDFSINVFYLMGPKNRNLEKERR